MTHSGVNQDWPRFVRLEAAAVCDWRGAFAPGALLVEVEGPRKLRVLAAGRPEDVQRHPAAAGAAVERHPDSVLIPGLVNAHAHLDLTHIGARAFEAEKGFGGFVDLVRRERRTEAAEIAASVRLGVEKSLTAGVVAVGDIAGAVRGRASTAAVEALGGAALAGVSYVEFFAIGKGERAGIEGLRQALASLECGQPVWRRVGVSPHATNTVSTKAYAQAVEIAGWRGLLLATHVGETLAEREFIAAGTGSHRTFLEQMGLWQPEMLEDVGHGRSPVAHTLRALAAEGDWEGWSTTFVHLNDCSDADLRLMEEAHVSVVYCPHASEYFGAPGVFGAHRYREMMEAGVRVALGTDSVINQPRGELSILAEMGLLYRRDGMDAETLLRMATEDGAWALGLNGMAFSFADGWDRLAGVVAAAADPEVRRKHPDWHPLRWVLEAEHPKADLLYIGTDYC